MTTEHQPGSPVDIAEFEAHGGSWSRNRLLDTAVLAVVELRTLRARVAELESENARLLDENEQQHSTLCDETKRAESAEARVKELEDDLVTERGALSYQRSQRVSLESSITDLESQLESARSSEGMLRALIALLDRDGGQKQAGESLVESCARASHTLVAERHATFIEHEEIAAAREERSQVLALLQKAREERCGTSHYAHHDPKGTAGANCPACHASRRLGEALTAAAAILEEEAKGG